MSISARSSDVCSSDLKTVEAEHIFARTFDLGVVARLDRGPDIRREKIGRRLVAIDRAERVEDLAVELAHVEQGERLAVRGEPVAEPGAEGRADPGIVALLRPTCPLPVPRQQRSEA